MSFSSSCLVCHEQRTLVGAACSECLAELQPEIAITPEQVRIHGRERTTAVLVDAWGRVHALPRRTVVGRVLEQDGLVILDATVSRRHALIELRGGSWHLTDLGAANGTFVDGRRLAGETALRDGERLRFGSVQLFFLDCVVAPPLVDTNRLGPFTVRDAVDRALARPGPRHLTIELREPSGGGGGVAVIDGRPVQLTLAQFELVSLLVERAQRAGDGFVTAGELVGRLSLESSEPGEDHVRQLVRRLRRVLFQAGIPGLIESRYGCGYRIVLLRA